MKCVICKNSNLTDDKFSKNKKGNLNKTCDRCLALAKDRGATKCPHGKQQKRCVECGGAEICEHKKNKFSCYKCKAGARFCEHKRSKQNCKDCKGSGICEHNKRRNECVACDGGSICEHKRIKYTCVECDGSSICEHKKRKNVCVECSGSSICEHKTETRTCKVCCPLGYIAKQVSNAVHHGLVGNKQKRSIEYLGCSIEEFKTHIETKFKVGMSWQNHGEWHIDHIIPLRYEDPTLEDVIERLHWKNTQPLWAIDNIRKGNRFIG